ncbi:hypothetical protein BH11PAT1_BH11PAT1_7530 [soil metagenome]
MLLGLGLLFFVSCTYILISVVHSTKETTYIRPVLWKFQSIDTMKYSRDVSREKLIDPQFDFIIDQQMRNIAKTGATHVAIATPYDEEFIPILTRWVSSARRYNLHIWFRGNFSGWEQWFGYSKITRAEHIKKTQAFILAHNNLFVDGDVFSACPECENGGPGDPRMNGDVNGHREFLIHEYQVSTESFKKIGKNVSANYNSMNGDVARLIMNQDTTKALGGIVVIDHYVATSEKMNNDIDAIARQSGGKIILGEFGAPIPDINGTMTENEQKAWMSDMLHTLSQNGNVVGLNYWVSVGGSTELWNAKGKEKHAVSTLSSYFLPATTQLTIKNRIGQNIADAEIKIGQRSYKSDRSGFAAVPTALLPATNVEITAKGYTTEKGILEKENSFITLEILTENLSYKVIKLFKSILNLL